MLTVGHFAQGGAALAQYFAHFAGTQANSHISTFTSNQLHGCTSTASNLCAFTRLQLDRVDRATDRNVTQRQGVTRLDRRLGTGYDLIASAHTLGCDDVATLAVSIFQQSDVRSTVRIVFDTLNGGWNAILVATKIDQTVMLLVTAPAMTRGDTAIIVTRAANGAPLCRSEFTTLTTKRRPAEVGLHFTSAMMYPFTYSALAKSMS